MIEVVALEELLHHPVVFSRIIHFWTSFNAERLIFMAPHRETRMVNGRCTFIYLQNIRNSYVLNTEILLSCYIKFHCVHSSRYESASSISMRL